MYIFVCGHLLLLYLRIDVVASTIISDIKTYVMKFIVFWAQLKLASKLFLAFKLLKPVYVMEFNSSFRLN